MREAALILTFSQREKKQGFHGSKREVVGPISGARQPSGNPSGEKIDSKAHPSRQYRFSANGLRSASAGCQPYALILTFSKREKEQGFG